MPFDKEQHKREQNEQFENSFKQVQKYYEKQFKRDMMLMTFGAIAIVTVLICVLLIVYFKWMWSHG